VAEMRLTRSPSRNKCHGGCLSLSTFSTFPFLLGSPFVSLSQVHRIVAFEGLLFAQKEQKTEEDNGKLSAR